MYLSRMANSSTCYWIYKLITYDMYEDRSHSPSSSWRSHAAHTMKNVVEIKNCAPNGPEGQLSKGRLRAVQCRPPILVPCFLELRVLEQGKYEEKKRRKIPKGGATAENL